MAKVLVKRGTRAQLDAAKTANGLSAGELYLVTDDGSLAIGTGVGSYVDAAIKTHNHDATYAPIAKGVTNGDTHDHSGGDGGTVAYANLSGLPTLGTAAAKNTGTSGNTVPLLDGVNTWSQSNTFNSGVTATGLFTVNLPSAAAGSTAGAVNTLQLYQSTATGDAFLTFHIASDTAVHFGLDTTTNDLFVGGWSLGANKYRIWHALNDGTGSGLDADLLDGQHGSYYQPKDADLTAIAALAGTSGLLKKTAADTWTLDTSAYLTGNQSVSLTGDATGSGSTSIAVTLASSGVTAGTYGSVTVDAKGRVTAGTNPATPFTMVVACSDETTVLTTGTSKVSFRMPAAVTLTGVKASLSTAQSGGSPLVTVDINKNGTSILSTKLTLDLNETTTVTAATPAVISNTDLAADDLITVDIDSVASTGPTAKGLKITLIGTYA